MTTDNQPAPVEVEDYVGSGTGFGTKTLTVTDRVNVSRDFTWYDPSDHLFTDSVYHYWFVGKKNDPDLRPDMTRAWYDDPDQPAPFHDGTKPPTLPLDSDGEAPTQETVVSSGSNSLHTYTAFNGLIRNTYTFQGVGPLNGKVQRIEQIWEGDTVEVYRAAYDAEHGRLIRSFDAEGNETNYSYVDRDDVSKYAPMAKTSVTDPLGHTRTSEQDIHANVTKMTDPTGVVVELVYDARNRLTEVKNTADVVVATLAYNERDDITALTDGAGATWRYTWQDFHGRSLLKEIESPTGLTATRTYDAAGQITATTRSDGFGESFSWNVDGLLDDVTDAFGNATGFSYDDKANLTTTTYADTTTSTATYDRRELVESETDPNGHTVSYQIDPSGWLSKLIDAKTQTTEWTEDGNDGTDRKTYEDNTKDEYTRDDRGLLTRFRHRSGTAVIDYDYDAAGQMTERSWIHGPTMAGLATYEYDDAGRLTDSAATASSWPLGLSLDQDFSYDADGRLASVSQNARTLTVERDAAGRIATIVYPGGMEVDYEYNDDGEVTGIRKDEALLAAYTMMPPDDGPAAASPTG